MDYDKIDFLLKLTLSILAFGFSVFLLLDAFRFSGRLGAKGWIEICVGVALGSGSLLQLYFDEKIEKINKDNLVARDNRIEILNRELESEKQVIRSVTAVLNVHVQGRWRKEKPPVSNSLVTADPEKVIFLEIFYRDDAGPNSAKFYSTKRNYEFAKQTDEYFIFIAELSVKPDDRLLGRKLDVLSTTVGGVAHLPVVFSSENAGLNIIVPKVTVEITLNNKIVKSKTLYQMHSFTLGNSDYYPIGLSLDGSIFN